MKHETNRQRHDAPLTHYPELARRAPVPAREAGTGKADKTLDRLRAWQAQMLAHDDVLIIMDEAGIEVRR